MTAPVGVVVVTGSCCFPGMQDLDRAASVAVETASADAGVPVEVKVLSATAALAGALPQHLMGDVMAKRNGEELPLPIVLIAGRPVDVGRIDARKVADELRRVAPHRVAPQQEESHS